VATAGQRKVLIVEDNDDVAQLVKTLLEDDTRLAVIGITDNAQTAMELADAEQPHLVVLDHALRGPTTGLMAAAMLKDIAPGAHIVMFTAFPIEDEAGLEPAIDAIVTKVDFAALLPLAQRLLGLEPSP
jgi:CheY-like chemotaxis protein